MTRAEFIKEAVKQLWGVPIYSKDLYGYDADPFKGCTGVECPKDSDGNVVLCEACKYKDFWEKEV